MQTVLILENIRSAENVGSLFRTADAAGIGKVYLCGYTPDPIDRFGRERKDIQKAALGAEKSILWEHSTTTLEVIRRLQAEKFKVIAVELHSKATDYKKIKPEERTAFVLGNEVDGLSAEVLAEVDEIAEIPMRGKKESLNVAVAGGIALFRILDL